MPRRKRSGCDDDAVDVEQRPAALPRHRADQPLALDRRRGTSSPHAAQLRAASRSARAACARPAGRPRCGRRRAGARRSPRRCRVAEVERADLELTAGPAPSGRRRAPRRRARRPGPRRRARGRARRGGPRHASARSAARRSSSMRVAGHEHALGRDRGRVLLLAEVQPVGGDRERAGGAERRQQLEARARGRGRAARGARTRARSAAPATSRARPGTPRPASRRARPRPGRPGRCAGRRRGCRAASPLAQLGCAATIASCSSVARRAGEREQEREPDRLLQVGLLGDRRVRAGRLEPRVGPGERGGEALGVGGRAQAGHERVAVAVVGGAGDALRVTTPGERARLGVLAAAARARARAAAPEPVDVALGLELAAADRAVRGQAVMAAEERHRAS